MKNSNGDYNFVSFVFCEFKTFEANTSEVIYPGYQNGGIINAADLPTTGYDTTHEYIEIEISMAGFDIGKALLYNMHYAG